MNFEFFFTQGYHTSSFMWTFPHFEGKNYSQETVFFLIRTSSFLFLTIHDMCCIFALKRHFQCFEFHSVSLLVSQNKRSPPPAKKKNHAHTNTHTLALHVTVVLFSLLKYKSANCHEFSVPSSLPVIGHIFSL